MIKCKLCKRQTEPRETTGKLNTMVYVDPKNRSKGKRFFQSKIVCMNCKGECSLK